MNKKIIWILFFLAIIGVVFGLIKLASIPAETNKNINNELLAPVITEEDNTIGNKEAKITLIEYSDFQCPACNSYFPILEKINKEFGNDILFVYRHFPLKQIHKNADLSARASQSAKEQDKFWEMHNIIFINQDEWANNINAIDIFIKYAENLDLDIEKFKNDIESDKIKNKVDSDYKGGLRSGVNSTPSFFLNRKKIQNPRSLDEFRNIIKNELKKEIPETEENI